MPPGLPNHHQHRAPRARRRPPRRERPPRMVERSRARPHRSVRALEHVRGRLAARRPGARRRAAARMHDELLGRSTALHLFSDLLPFRRWATGLARRAEDGRALSRPPRDPRGVDRPRTDRHARELGAVPHRRARGEPLATACCSAGSRASSSTIRRRCCRQPGCSAPSYLDQTGALRPAVLRSRPLSTFTSNIQKGGALLDDARRLVGGLGSRPGR